MTIARHVRRHQTLYALLLVAALARVLFLFDYHEVWWDSGVYLGMAKYAWSGGTAGLWEHIRPVLWPFIIGSAWWLKLNMVWFARILEFLLAIISTGLVYVLGRKWFSQRAAILASTLWAFSAIVFYLGFHEYTELPAVTLMLIALVAFMNKRWFLAGLFTSLAFLMKFPAGILLVALGLVLIVQKSPRSLVPLGLGFAVPAGAFLAFNQTLYGTMLGPLLDARENILSVLGCNVLRFNPWWQYFMWALADNWLNLFALFGLGAMFVRWKKQHVLPLLSLISPAAYLLQLHCREYRYLVLFLPFVVLFTGQGIAVAGEWLERQALIKRYAWPAVMLLVVAISVFHGILFYHGNEVREPDPAAEDYARWLAGRQIDGEIWSSNPVVSVYTDAPVHKIYYPIYQEGIATTFNAYLAAHAGRIGAVLLDNCGGGIVCHPADIRCAEQLTVMRSFLNQNFKQVFFAQSGECWYAIYAH
jgi:4-amino-4-deoxy-L-arabinose transferase-like glycosyltransferase